MADQGTEPRITVADAATIALGPWADKPDDLGPDMRALVLWRAPDSVRPCDVSQR